MGYRSAATLLAAAGSCISPGPAAAGPPDIETLTVDRSVSTGEVVLAWSNGVPSFSVRRSNSASFPPSHNTVYLTRSTLARSFRDPTLDDGIDSFYLVEDSNQHARLCPDPVPPPIDGQCDFAPDGGAGPGLLIRGNVLEPDWIALGGSVLIDGSGMITCVGCDCSATEGFADARHLECADSVVSPGLINPHDHITFSENAPLGARTERYDHRHEWRTGLNGHTELVTPANLHGGGATSTGSRWVEIRMAMSGVTSMAGSGRANGMVRNLDYAGGPQEGLAIPNAELATFPLGDANAVFQPNCGWNYADTESQVAGFAAYVPHVAEGIDSRAAEEFFCQSRSTDGGHDFTESNAAHVHGLGLTASDYLRMAHDSAQLIWSPRSNISLYGMTAQVTTFDVLGGTIALGTDWSYSGSINGPRELACADLLNREYYAGHFSDKELWEMATRNAARTLNAETRIGSIEVGKVADLAVFDDTSGQHYRSIIDATASDVALVLRGGTALYGESDVLTGLGETCETLDVCGELRALCAAREFGGISYTVLAIVVAGGYPAFFCGTPPDEPTCVPSRPGEFTGLSVSEDVDGDGIENTIDNCATVFNPVRPQIDDAVQGDSDGDGLGDACDPVPLNPDLDGDTVPNDVDNCPWDFNQLQLDDDADGKGNECDGCPEVANPDTGCSAPSGEATIVEIQTGVISAGTVATVRGVVVTGVGSNTFHVQDPDVGPDSRFSGVAVYAGGTPPVTVNDVIDITGEVQEFFGDTQLANLSNLTIVGNASPVVPTAVTVAEAAGEDYEGVLVTLTDGVVTDTAFDCPPPCTDTGLWEIGGSAGVLAYDRYYQDMDWTSQIGRLPITGVMMYRFDRRRILPRTATDFP